MLPNWPTTIERKATRSSWSENARLAGKRLAAHMLTGKNSNRNITGGSGRGIRPVVWFAVQRVERK